VVRQRPELVAHHLTEAGEAEQAVEAWQTAGDYATARAALVEANQHYNKALEILKTLPDTPDRAQMELPLQISLGQIASALNGFGSIEEAQAFSRAREIAEQLDESPQFFFILLGLWSSTNTRSEIKASRELSAAMLRIADRDQTPLMEVWAHLTQAIDAYAIGNFIQVGEHVDLVRSYYNQDEHTWAPFDPYVTVLGHASYALWQLGYADQAFETRTMEIARQISLTMSPWRMTTCNLSILADADSMMAAAQDMTLVKSRIHPFVGTRQRVDPAENTGDVSPC
jgi:predicted ATPase